MIFRSDSLIISQRMLQQRMLIGSELVVSVSLAFALSTPADAAVLSVLHVEFWLPDRNSSAVGSKGFVIKYLPCGVILFLCLSGLKIFDFPAVGHEKSTKGCEWAGNSLEG